MESLDELRESAQKMIIVHIQFPKLLIAVVNGPCIGIAPTIVALCDVVYASDTVNASEIYGQHIQYVNQFKQCIFRPISTHRLLRWAYA